MSRLWYTQNVPPKLYTTREAAEAAGISRATLQSWIASKKVDAPEKHRSARVRLWTATDVTLLKRKKKEIYQEGHTRKPNRKQ